MKKNFLILALVILLAFLAIKSLPTNRVLGVSTKISDLTAYTTPLATDVLPINDVANSTTKKITISNFFSFITGTYPVQNSNGTISLAFGTTTNNLWSGTNIWQNSSSTVVGDLTIGGNSTTTSFFATTASSTKFFGAGLPGAGCTGSSFLQYSAGKYSCGATSAGVSTFSTTSVQQLATTTLHASEIPAGNNCTIQFDSPYIVGSASTSDSVDFAVNYSTDPVGGEYWGQALRGTSALTTNSRANFITLLPATSGGNLFDIKQQTIRITIDNFTNVNKTLNWNGLAFGTSSNSYYNSADSGGAIRGGVGYVATSSSITSIDIWMDRTNSLFGTTTKLSMTCL